MFLTSLYFMLIWKVDYACTPEEVQQHFQACGTVNRVTILTDKFGQPKGFAYVEFIEQEAIQEALQLNESELHGRQLKVKFISFTWIEFLHLIKMGKEDHPVKTYKKGKALGSNDLQETWTSISIYYV